MLGNMLWEILKPYIYEPFVGEKGASVTIVVSFLFLFFLYKIFIYFWEKIYPKFKKNPKEIEEDLEKKIDDSFRIHSAESDKDLTKRLTDVLTELAKISTEHRQYTTLSKEFKDLNKKFHSLELEVSKIKGHLGLE